MIIASTRFGGMENASAIVFSKNLFRDLYTKQPRSRKYDIPEGVRDVVAHEVAHQWFGDSVTEATWADLWLSEGFATYFGGLFVERFEGKRAFRAFMQSAADAYLKYAKERKAPLHDRDTEDLNKLLNANNYKKGAWVVHMLRGHVGDRAFFAGIRNYYRSHRNATATTEDLRGAMEKASGLDLKAFFTRWVYQSGHPRYRVTWEWTPASAATAGAGVELEIEQVQDDEVFMNPLTVEIVTTRGAKRVTVVPTGRKFTTRIRLDERPRSVKIDPDEWVLKELTIAQREQANISAVLQSDVISADAWWRSQSSMFASSVMPALSR